ncbi:MAG: RecB family exonuclease, partial [Phascolarctobacterium sp.]
RAFSPSSLQTYLHCQRQYFYQYVMGLPGLEEELEVDAVAEQASPEEVGAEQNVAEQASAEQNVAEQAGMAIDAAGSTSTAQPAFYGSLSAKDLGSIVHKALEYYKGDLEAALAKAIQEVAPLYTGNEARSMLEGYLASDLYKRIPKQTLREQAFTIYEDNGIVLSGIIDCLGVQSDGSLLLVDYKTGRPPVAGAINKGYAYQLAIYEKVVRERWAKGKDESTKLTAELHFLRNNTAWNLEAAQAGLAANAGSSSAVDVDTKSQSAYYAEALALCAEISKKSTESEFACKEQKHMVEAQNVAACTDNGAITQVDAKNISQGVAHCDYCPYNYVCNHK